MHKGIHSRGYLPHWGFADSTQAITFRLGNSLSAKVIQEWTYTRAGQNWSAEFIPLLNPKDIAAE